MTIGICSRCKRSSLLYSIKDYLCMSCYISLRYRKKALEGKITDKERENRRINFKKWYNENKEHQKKNVKRYYHNNKKKCFVRNRTQLLRKNILHKFNNNCSECSSVENLEVHHLKYNKVKIKMKLTNVTVLCRDCHRKLHRLENVYPKL